MEGIPEYCFAAASHWNDWPDLRNVNFPFETWNFVELYSLRDLFYLTALHVAVQPEVDVFLKVCFDFQHHSNIIWYLHLFYVENFIQLLADAQNRKCVSGFKLSEHP